MQGNECPRDDELTALAAGEATPVSLERFAAHVAACAGCQQRLARFDRSADPTGNTPTPTLQLDRPRQPDSLLADLPDRGQLAASAPVRARPAEQPPSASPGGTPTGGKPVRRFSPWASGLLPRREHEIRDLLRWRLSILLSCFALLCATGLGLVLGGRRLALDPGVLNWLGLSAPAVTAVVLIAIVVLLGLRPGISLTHLRICEAIAFGLLVLTFGSMHYRLLAFPLPGGYEGPRHAAVQLNAGNQIGMFSFWGLIVVYGIIVPNSWRRAVLVIGVLAAIPLLVTAAAALTNEVLRAQLPFRLIWQAVILSTGVATALFGSFKISTLQEEAFAARQLGQYHLKELLGTGGMGEVYLAEHLLLKRPCAVKLILPERASDPQLLQRFEREVQVTARLTHFNTVAIFDYGHTDDGTFYYVMEYLPGPSLEQLVQRYSRLPAARVIHFLRQLCGALREAHGIGLVHRDLKPSNVLVCKYGGLHDVVKLLDFGLVRAVPVGLGGATKLTQEGIIMGTPDFIAPEQAKGQALVDARSDLYSLGALAYYLLTGRPPFEAETALELLFAHVHLPVRPPTELRPEVPADLEAVVLRCLAKQPAQRFADAEELDRALGGCQDAGRWTEMQARLWWQNRRVEQPEAGSLNTFPLP